MYQDEHPVPPELARALIASQFPQLAPIRLSLAGEGWDNLVYRVNDRWVFRFPRRRLAVECLRHELAVTPRLERRLPLPISAPRFFGKPTEPYPHPFAGYDWLNGVTADSLRLDDAARSALAGPLGHFLRALHDVTGEEARSWGAPGDLIGRMDLAMRAPRTKEHLRTLHERNVLPATAPGSM
ncbi:MAG: phosphotransferase [Candidatus Eisenbacteria bacterium]